MERIYSSRDIEQINEAEKQLRARGLDESVQRLADLTDEFFQTNRGVLVTVAAIVKLIESQPGLKWLSMANLEYLKVANQEPDRANHLANWLATHGGKPGQLTNTPGDATFENLTLLLSVLRGYEISSPRIQDGIDRISNRAGRKLHYVPTPRREMGTITEAARNDDGKPFVTDGLTLQRDGSLGKSPADYAREARQRSDRQAAEAASQRSGASAQSAAVRDAKNKAESMRGNTHSESEQIGRIFVTAGTDIDWPATLQARSALQKSLNKAQEVRRFIR
jgi:hypothetical protein